MKKTVTLLFLLVFSITALFGCATSGGSGQIAEAEISDYVRQNLSGEFIPADSIEAYIKDSGEYIRIEEIGDYVRENMSEEFVALDEMGEYLAQNGYVERGGEMESKATSPAVTPKPSKTPVVTPEPSKTPPADEAGEKVGSGAYVGSKNSDKYHEPSCKWAQKIKPSNEVWFDSKEAAQSAGYIACKVCKP